MRKPHAIIDLLSDHSQVVIDLFEIADLTACTEYENPDTGEIVRLDKEHCQILMNDGNEYIVELSISDALYFSKQMWKSKVKDNIRKIFKEY